MKILNKNKMAQTAVEWLAEQITTVKWKMSDVTDRNSIIEQAKEMEKEQRISDLKSQLDYFQNTCNYAKAQETFLELRKAQNNN